MSLNPLLRACDYALQSVEKQFMLQASGEVIFENSSSPTIEGIAGCDELGLQKQRAANERMGQGAGLGFPVRKTRQRIT